MGFFDYFFPEYDWSKKEVAVRCPFPHHTELGTEYFENNPSAHINQDKRTLHCKVCGVGLSEVNFIATILGTTYQHAIKIQREYEKNTEDSFSWNELELTKETKELALNLGISKQVIEDLNLKTQDNGIAFPVLMYDKILDSRVYTPGGTPKVKSRKGAMTGLIIPYDIWEVTSKDKWTIICAGEKDMAVARSHGFNAITLTGGEQVLPLFKEPFKDRRVAICYDKDSAGLRGANKLAAHLFNVAKEVRVVTNFHEVLEEDGEDITDFFIKYNKTEKDLKKYVLDTPAFTGENAREVTDQEVPLVALIEATKPNHVNKIVRTNVQVTATYDTAFTMPNAIVATKIGMAGDAKYNTMAINEKREWYLNETNAQDLLKLIDNNFNEEQIRLNIRDILQIPKQERDIRIQKPSKEAVYKCSVTDYHEVNAKDAIQIEFLAYSIGKKLESGKRYQVTYKVVPHPYKGQVLIMIILDVQEAHDSITNFKVTDKVKEALDQIKNLKGTVEERVHYITEKFKGELGYDGYNQLIQAFDFAYHTVLEFNFGTFKDMRGYLDTLIVAESRVGKSTTAETMQHIYNLGTFVSLAGSSATIPGLIGGSHQTGGGFQTRAGAIPRNHRGLMIFEELAKSGTNILKELTDIKSSNQVRINRVSGELTLPALVRMITVTNVKNTGSTPRSIISYPNGIEIVLELVETPEDIARFDMILVLGTKGEQTIDPLWVPEEPFDSEVYRTRVRWIWSRTPEQVVFCPKIERYIMSECNKLNEIYNSHIKIFGTEAWKKVARLAVSIAGYLVSTDDTYENIIIKKEHVDYAIKFLVDMYDNETFRLREYVEQERKYSTLDEDGLALLQELYLKAPNLLTVLAQSSISTRNNLQTATGMGHDEFSKVMAKLVRGFFVTYKNYDIVPTERFRLGMNQINKTMVVARVGELSDY